MLHYHILYTPPNEYIEKRSGAIQGYQDCLNIRDSMLRNGIAIWANVDTCEDKDCVPFSQKEFYNAKQ